MRLYELFTGSSAASYVLKQHDDEYVGEFTIEDHKYQVYFECQDDSTEKSRWDFSFALTHTIQTKNGPYNKREFGDSGTGNAFIVYATVVAVLREFINKVKPGIIDFEGHKADSGSGNKAGLYDRMMRKLGAEAQQMGYTPITLSQNSSKNEYCLIRKDLSVDPAQQARRYGEYE